ncbi:hypothetical protein A9Q77_01510 [Marinomonas sp. 42_23_T18]|nr:hypothetical protein A9Q77_01510 [Marinomonas sp. 42_23_T18]
MQALGTRFFASKKLLLLQFLCWCCFFALPAINAQGQVSGYWVSLCTTAGIELVKIESSSDDSKQHQTSQCPCMQDVIDISYPALDIHQNFVSLSILSHLSSALVSAPYTPGNPRAPPPYT